VVAKDNNFKEKISLLVKSWRKENIYNFNNLDSSLYFVLYIVIPIIITFASLNALNNDDNAIVYCYVTILISTLNGVYDSINRWKSGIKSIHNTKLFIIIVSNAVIGIYCTYVIVNILINPNWNCRMDCILLVYFFTIVVALSDICACVSREMALFECVRKNEV